MRRHLRRRHGIRFRSTFLTFAARRKSRALEMAREGDLVMMFGDDITRTWKQIIGHEVADQPAPGDEAAKPQQSFVEEDPTAFMLEPGEELIRDERGVRIAHQEEPGD